MTRPNILFIVTDQQHADSIGALGYEGISTPALDSLVEGGMSFGASYTTNPVCSPARASLFTGRMPSETGVIVNRQHIRADLPTLGESLSEGGYDTVYAGKWHVPMCYTTSIRGFRVISTGHKHQGTVSDPSVTESCVQWLHAHADESMPFCMVASYMQPHDVCNWLRHNRTLPDNSRYPEVVEDHPELPDNATSRPQPEPASQQAIRAQNDPSWGNWDELHQRYYLWSYRRQVEMVDVEVARLLRTLEATGQRDNTLIIFTSDHGEGLMHHGMTRKGYLYDEAVRVPLIVNGPGVQRGQDNHTLVSGVDLMPTICSLAGLDAIPETVGEDLTPLLDGSGSISRPYIVTEAHGNQGRMVRSQQYKYVVYKGDSAEQLFDLQADPGETVNRVHDPELAPVLNEHRQWLREHLDSLDVADSITADERFDSSVLQGIGE